MRSFHTPTQKFHPKFPIFHQSHQILNFPLFYNENRTSPKFYPLSHPLSSKPLFHNTFPPSLTQNSTKNFHKFTLPSQLSSLYKGIFTMYYFYVKKITIQLFSKSKIFNLQTENNNISHKSKNKETKTMRLTNEEILTQFPS